MSNPYRALPSSQKLLQHAQSLIAEYGYDDTLTAINAALDRVRQQIAQGQVYAGDEVLLRGITQALETQYAPTLRAVINATGVIIHTNLGRTLLSESAQRAITDIGGHYNTLEYDLAAGKRGSRYLHAETALTTLTGAEAALVVNNTAAALVLILSALAQQKGVILSRAHLVEIGGGFRIPDIMLQSGARLNEVGTTNRTRLNDYAAAIDAHTALLMRVHSSNFKIIGFVEEVPLTALAALADERGIALVDDLGSGALVDTAQYGLAHEPTAQASIAAGAHLVAFSGDKLLGGPQAGIILGKQALIARLKAHPLARALRADKLCYAALGATLDHYRRGDYAAHIPVWQMVSTPLSLLTERAQRWAAVLGGAVVDGQSTIGGGSLPGETLPTSLLALTVNNADAFVQALRRVTLPIIARVQDGRVLFDPRTVLPEEDVALLAGITHVLRDV